MDVFLFIRAKGEFRYGMTRNRSANRITATDRWDVDWMENFDWDKFEQWLHGKQWAYILSIAISQSVCTIHAHSHILLCGERSLMIDAYCFLSPSLVIMIEMHCARLIFHYLLIERFVKIAKWNISFIELCIRCLKCAILRMQWFFSRFCVGTDQLFLPSTSFARLWLFHEYLDRLEWKLQKHFFR